MVSNYKAMAREEFDNIGFEVRRSIEDGKKRTYVVFLRKVDFGWEVIESEFSTKDLKDLPCVSSVAEGYALDFLNRE